MSESLLKPLSCSWFSWQNPNHHKTTLQPKTSIKTTKRKSTRAPPHSILCCINRHSCQQSEQALNLNNSGIRKLCRENNLQEALQGINKMLEMEIDVQNFTYQSFLRACGKTQNLIYAKKLHRLLITLEKDSEFVQTLIYAYAMCNTLLDARMVFDKTQNNMDVSVLNDMIYQYVRHKCYDDALEVYALMPEFGIAPNNYILPQVLKACSALSLLKGGRQIHTQAIKTGLISHDYVKNALVSMYSNCGEILEARKVFDEIISGFSSHMEFGFGSQVRDLVMWNSMISGYVRRGHYSEGLELLRNMDCCPNYMTIVSAIPACSALKAVREGVEIHGYAIRTGIYDYVEVQNATIDMYGRFNRVSDAIRVFENMRGRDIVSWNSILNVFVNNGMHKDAAELFLDMETTNLRPDCVTLCSIFSSCSKNKDLEFGKYVHDFVRRNSIKLDTQAHNAMLGMYVHCKNVTDGRQVFDRMSNRSVVSWSIMIHGYRIVGKHDEALRVFRTMQCYVKPNFVTVVTVISVCGDRGNVRLGKEMHAYIVKNQLMCDVVVGNALVDMYSKCGDLKSASNVFERMKKRDITSWTSMISGYGMHGRGKDAMLMFERLKESGIKPNRVTFLAVLCACSRSGMVPQGWRYFKEMSSLYWIQPGLMHYAAMVDLMGKSGMLDEAHEFVKRMPLKPDVGVWGALLGSCRVHKNVQLAEHVAKIIFKLAPDSYGHYMLLQNIYKDAGQWEAVGRLRNEMKKRSLLKSPRCSCIEINGSVHSFMVGDRSHPQAYQVYEVVDKWAVRMAEAGYPVKPNFVLHSELACTTEEDICCEHTEKLAIAFGLLNSPPMAPIHVHKNLRMCEHCHEAVQFISKTSNRVITVRDTYSLHTFKDGSCSCQTC